MVGELADTLRQMRTEASLLRYLKALHALQRSAFLVHTRRITRIRLQVLAPNFLGMQGILSLAAGCTQFRCMLHDRSVCKPLKHQLGPRVNMEPWSLQSHRQSGQH